VPLLADIIRDLRMRAGLTQEELGERAGIATVTVEKLEQGKTASARDRTLAALARALGVPKHRLEGTTGAAAAIQTSRTDDVALVELRRAFEPIVGLGPVPTRSEVFGLDRLPEIGAVADEIRRLDRAYHDDDYPTVLDSLPLLIAQSRALVAEADSGDTAGPATGLMVQAIDRAGTMLTQLRHLDLAHTALTNAITAARATDNVMAGASAVTTMCWVLMRQGRSLEAEDLAIATADAINPAFGPRADPVALRAWGWLMIDGASSAARDNRPADAEMYLAAAAAAATRVGPWRPDFAPSVAGPAPSIYIAAFGPSAVAMAGVEAAVIAGEAARAVELAKRVQFPDRWLTDSQHRHLLFVATAHTQLGQFDEAAAILRRLGAEAPTWLLHQRSAADTVESMRSGWRGNPTDLAELAGLVGLTAAAD
jgi:transcriptional regulator with XRE-family HTH domain